MTEWPRITLVTPSYNQGAYLEATLCSVLEQDYPNLEYIVIDGGSQDGSLEILQRYSDHLDYWISEPDKGQSDAIIKGFNHATGELMNWLNSDDLLLTGSLQAVAQAYMDTGGQIIVGEDWHFRDNPQNHVRHFIPEGYSFPGCLQYWEGNFIYHQPCTFFTRDVYENVGGLDHNLHFAMDYDLYCRLLSQPDINVVMLKRVISAFRLHNESKTLKYKKEFLRELQITSMRYWQVAGLDVKKSKKEIDCYNEKCLIYHMVEHFRNLKFVEDCKSLKSALIIAPHFCVLFLLKKLYIKLHER